jgi:hypothetical protein
MKNNTKKDYIVYPYEKFRVYLKKVNISSVNELTNASTQKILFALFEDFKTHKLQIDEFSAICGIISKSILDGDTNITGMELKRALDSAAELSHYVRIIHDKETGLLFAGFMVDVVEYYERNKNK